jgi:hypothetical protein
MSHLRETVFSGTTTGSAYTATESAQVGPTKFQCVTLPFMKATLLVFAVTIAVGSVLVAQSKITALAKVYVGADGLAHVVDGRAKDTPIHKEKNQAGVSSPKLAADKQAAGWLIEQENCCTSYTIPTILAVYRGGKMRLLGDGLMIYDWCFVGEGVQVAMSTGTVHGMTSRHLRLYDVRTGRVLQEWNGAPDASAPNWAKGLQQ